MSEADDPQSPERPLTITGMAQTVAQAHRRKMPSRGLTYVCYCGWFASRKPRAPLKLLMRA